MQNEMKKVLPPEIGRIFREMSGKGPEKIYVEVIGNSVILYISGFITAGLVESKLLQDSMMKTATNTYYTKVAHNSMERICRLMKEKFCLEVESVLSDFNVETNTGVIFYEVNKMITSAEAINGSYHNFVRNKITEIFRKNTGAYPLNIDIYLNGGNLFIQVGGFLGSFNEVKFKYDEELIAANRMFYYGVLKNELNAMLDDFSVDAISFSTAYCDVNILKDYAMIYLRGR